MGERLRRWTPSLAWGLVALSVCLAAAAKWLLPQAELQKILVRNLTPWLVFEAGLAMATVAATAWQARRAAWVQREYLVGAACIAVLGVVASSVLAPPTHRLFFDEDIYAQIGVSMAVDGRAGMLDAAVPDPRNPAGWRGFAYSLNKEPTGYPLLVALATPFVGVRDDLGAHVSLGMFALGILGLALLMRETQLFASRPLLKLLGPLFYALWPENLRWAQTGAVELSAAASAIWALALGLRAGRTRQPVDRIPALLVGVLAAQVRPEGMLVFIPLALAIGGLPRLSRAELRLQLRAIAPYTALVAVLVAPHAMHIASQSHEDWGANGPKFSWAVVGRNLQDNIGYWIKDSAPHNTPTPPLGITPLAALGVLLLIARAWSSRSRSGIIRTPSGLKPPERALGRTDDTASRVSRETLWTIVVGLWGLLFFSIFIPFYAGSCYYGVDVRFLLLVVPAFTLMAGVGAGFLAVVSERFGSAARAVTVLALVLVPLAVPLTKVPLLSPEAHQARADHTAVGAFARQLPANAIVISHTPFQWSMRRVAGVQLVWAWNHPEGVEALMQRYPVFYHYNYWDIAGTSNAAVAQAKSFGAQFLDRYSTDTFAVVESEAPYVFSLHRLKMIVDTGTP